MYLSYSHIPPPSNISETSLKLPPADRLKCLAQMNGKVHK